MRQFLSRTAPEKNGLLEIAGRDYRHLRGVLRMRVGDMLPVRLPDGSLQNMTVCAVDERRSVLTLQVCDAGPRRAEPHRKGGFSDGECAARRGDAGTQDGAKGCGGICGGGAIKGAAELSDSVSEGLPASCRSPAAADGRDFAQFARECAAAASGGVAGRTVRAETSAAQSARHGGGAPAEIAAPRCFSDTAPAVTEYWLFQFIAKPQKMELIVRQAAECGVRYIVPVIGQYSQKGGVAAMQSGRSARLERIIREARQQSGSPVETAVTAPVSPAGAVRLWAEAAGRNGEESAAVILWERSEETRPLHQILRGGSVRRAAVAVGCEGGISPDEIKLFAAGAFVPVHFAGNILRCETAALYGIAAVQSALLENDIWEYKE